MTGRTRRQRVALPAGGVEVRQNGHPDEAEVLIPAGPFLMGRPESCLFAASEETPVRVVTLGAFTIDQHPVSNRRFRAFVEAGGYRRPELWTQEGWRWREAEQISLPRSFEHEELAGDDQPVAGVCWYEAQAFCRFAARRLPTSAEWERGARGLDARSFPWGEALPRAELCNHGGLVGRTTPLGRYPAGVSPCGLFDMAGNVNNWVEDLYWPRFGRWCLDEGYLLDPVLDDRLARELQVSPTRRTDRGGGFLTAFSRFEVLSTTLPLGWAAGSREPWHGFRTAGTPG